MPRANRCFVAGHVWHITHRCHKRQFLLKFRRDRAQWLCWLYEARKRYGLCVLNYVVTSNHIHLLVRDQGKGEIPCSMQLVAGRTAQQYNARKSRKGAFWDDRYYATAIETGRHLARCMIYIDLNMVRAGVVEHPAEWSHSGYREIQSPPSRYRIIDTDQLKLLLEHTDAEQLRTKLRECVQAALETGATKRESQWSESVAVGDRKFVESIKTNLASEANRRQIVEIDGIHFLREESIAYKVHFDPEKVCLSSKMTK